MGVPACKVIGHNRNSSYRLKEPYEVAKRLSGNSGDEPVLSNRVSEESEKACVEIAFDQSA